MSVSHISSCLLEAENPITGHILSQNNSSVQFLIFALCLLSEFSALSIQEFFINCPVLGGQTNGRVKIFSRIGEDKKPFLRQNRNIKK